MNGGSTPPLALFLNIGLMGPSNLNISKLRYVAQLAEQWTFNPTVLGSNPSIPITCIQEKKKVY